MSHDVQESQAHRRAGPAGVRTPSSTPGANMVAAGAVVATAAFAGGGLLTQTVLVPLWQSMDTSAFLTHFRTSGPATGATLFPIELASVGLLAATSYGSHKHHQPGRLGWSIATGCMIGTILLLPIHFIQANQALLDPDFPVGEVPAELSAWHAWNWVRTGLAVLASGLAVQALTVGRRGQE